jgi:hypothetical protein
MTQEPRITEAAPEKLVELGEDFENIHEVFLQARARRERRLTQTVLLLKALTILAERGIAMNLEWQLRPIDKMQADEAEEALNVVFSLPIF